MSIGKKKPTQFQEQLLAEIRENIRNAMPYDLRFKQTDGMSDAAKKRLQEELQHSFDIYMNTWISPWIDRLENSMNGYPE